MSSINVLFYSNNCPGSQTLIALMKDEGLFKYFHIVCTDNNPDVPKEIKFTPTLIVKNIPTPYVAGDAFVWLNKMKQWKLNEQIKRMNAMQKKHLEKTNMVFKDESSVLEFSKEEMGSGSDIYSYLEYDDALQQSYFDFNNIGKEIIYTPSGESEKLSEMEHKKLQNRLTNERTKQDIDFKRSIESFKNEMIKR